MGKEGFMLSKIRQIVEEYKKSTIQSEAEVRSKLIVPLLEALNYPSSLRAEEFPVYGFEGRKSNPAKPADFVLFSDDQFAHYRNKTQQNITWVYKHSLMVVEAKKPGEMPEIHGQAQYYSAWTRAVAYLAIDGEQIQGFYYTNINADPCVISCSIDELSEHAEILDFCYEKILQIKQNSFNDINAMRYVQSTNGFSNEAAGELLDATNVKYATEEDMKQIPERDMQAMRAALGRNSTGLTRLQIVTHFLSMTDAYLQNDMRYGVPEYMFFIPRNVYKAYLHIDNCILPLINGDATEYYWDDYEKFIFENKNITIAFLAKSGKIKRFEIGYAVTNIDVTERLSVFEKVREVLSAKTIRVTIADSNFRQYTLPVKESGMMWPEKEETMMGYTFWIEGLKQLKRIEEFYGVKFKLRPISGVGKVTKLYDAIQCVYNGIETQANCTALMPTEIMGKEVEFQEVYLHEEGEGIDLPTLDIHGVKFIPHQSWLIPGYYSAEDQDEYIGIPCCCKYKVS